LVSFSHTIQTFFISDPKKLIFFGVGLEGVAG